MAPPIRKPKFVYKARSAGEWEKRAQGGTDLKGFILDDFPIYQVRKGDNYIRILPPTWEDPHHYGIDVHVHYGLGPDRMSALCPLRMQNKRCPICEAAVEADRAGDEELKRELRATRRTLVYLIDRKDEEKGVQIWAMPQSVDKDIAGACRDPDTGEIYAVDDPYEGYNIRINVEGEGVQRRYTGVTLSRKQSSVADEHLEFIQEFPLPETLRWRTYKEMQTMYDGSNARGGDEDEDTSGREERRPAPRRTSREEPEERQETRRPLPRRSARSQEPADEEEQGEAPDEEQQEEEQQEERRPAPRRTTSRRQDSEPPADDRWGPQDEEQQETRPKSSASDFRARLAQRNKNR